MTQFIKKSITLGLLLLLINLRAFSQTLVLNELKDTTICFSLNQGKFLLKQVYLVKECESLMSICEKQNSLKDSAIKELKANILDYQRTIANDNHINWLKDEKISNLENDIINEKIATKRQKNYKWCAIIGGALLSGYTGYKYATKR